MSRPTPAGYTIENPAAFVLPPFAKSPIENALNNVNAAWLYHTPPLVQCLPADDYGSTETAGATYLIPVTPSADALPYRFKVAADASITLTRTYYVSSDTTLSGATYTSIGTATGSTGGDGIVSDGTYTIPANTTHLKIVLAAATTCFPQAILIYPEPATVPEGEQASGFVAYETDALNDSGAPLHKELFDRCRKSALAVWHDRKQNCFSLVANSAPDEDEGENHVAAVLSTVTRTAPKGRVRLPGYAAATRFSIKAIAETSAGTVSGAITVSITGEDSASVTLDASGAVVSTSATVTPAGAGLAAYVDVSVTLSGKDTSSVFLHSLMIYPEAS